MGMYSYTQSGGILLKKEMYELIKSISLKDFLIYLIGSILLSLLYGFTYYENWAGGVGASLYAINLSSSVFALGAPLVLGAAVLLRSPQPMELEMEQPTHHYARSLTLSRYIFLLLVSSIFVFSWILYSYSLAIEAYSHLSPDLILQYLPGTLVSGFLITAILCAIVLFVVTMMGDWRLASVTGIAFFYILGSSLGSSPSLHTSDSLAIFSPYHLYRFLAFGLSGNISDPVMGIIWADPGRMNMILGINFGFPEILLSLGLWITCGLVLLIFTQYPTGQNTTYVSLENRLNSLEADNIPLLSQLNEIKKALKSRRLAVGMVLVLMLILLPLARSSVASASEEENTNILYQSPSSGVSLALGDWMYGEVEVSAPTIGLNNMYQIRVQILDWGGCPEELELWRSLKSISISSFEAMNATEKDELGYSRSSSITSERTDLRGGFSSIQTTGTHLWVLKFVPAEGYPVQGVMRIGITITLRAS